MPQQYCAVSRPQTITKINLNSFFCSTLLCSAQSGGSLFFGASSYISKRRRSGNNLPICCQLLLRMPPIREKERGPPSARSSSFSRCHSERRRQRSPLCFRRAASFNHHLSNKAVNFWSQKETLSHVLLLLLFCLSASLSPKELEVENLFLYVAVFERSNNLDS